MTLLYLGVGITMLLLGKWQLSRAAEKVELLAIASEAQAREPVSIEELSGRPIRRTCEGGDCPAMDSGLDLMVSPVYNRVLLQGAPDGEHQFLWDNRIHKGVAGYEIITPVRLEDGRYVLANRGWLPVGTSREVLPDVAIDVATLNVEGVLTFPSKGLFQGEAMGAAPWDDWPKVIQYLEYGSLEAALQGSLRLATMELVPGVVQSLQSREGSASSAGADEILYADNWQPVANGPEKHYGYAAQWFAMFVALTVLYFWLNLSAPGTGKRED